MVGHIEEAEAAAVVVVAGEVVGDIIIISIIPIIDVRMVSRVIMDIVAVAAVEVGAVEGVVAGTIAIGVAAIMADEQGGSSNNNSHVIRPIDSPPKPKVSPPKMP